MTEELKEILESVTHSAFDYGQGRAFIDKGWYRIVWIDSDEPLFWLLIIDQNNNVVLDIKEEKINLSGDYERVRQFLIGLQDLIGASNIPDAEVLSVGDFFPIKAIKEARDCYVADDFKERLKAKKYLGKIIK